MNRDPFDLREGVLRRTTLTPALAAELLLRNSTNRPLREHRMAALCRDHLNGSFDGRAVHLMVDTDGNLINGQHTCTAVVRTGKPLENVLIEYGVDPQVADKLDRAIPRNVRDALARRGCTNINHLAATLTTYIHLTDYPHLIWNGSLRISEDNKLAVYEANRDRFDQAVLQAMTAYTHAGVNRATYGALAAFVGVDNPTWKEWHRAICSGEGLYSGDPRLTFLKWVRNPVAKEGGIRSQYRMVCTIRAWNAWATDQPIQILKWPGQSLPIPTPIIPAEAVRAVSV